MISMEMLGKIRRMYFRDKLSLHQIAKRTGLSRKLFMRVSISNALSMCTALQATEDQSLS